MKNKYNTLTCLFGHHDYSDEETEDKTGRNIRLCKICKRNGYYEWGDGKEAWFDYDEEGNMIYGRWSDGSEYWYDARGWCIHVTGSGGYETWKADNGHWVERKPKNWKHDNV